MFKKNTALFIPLLLAFSSSLFAAKFGLSPEANDDHGAMIVGVTITMEGNVLGNDFNGTFVDFTQLVGKYGYLNSVDSGGDYTYTLHDNVTPSSIPQGEVVTDVFPYVLSNSIRQTSGANLIIELSTVDIPEPEITSNVDVEFNDRSFQATPLNSGKNILGHLHSTGDKDWYSLPSAGNEIITLEACPPASSCFAKKSWVLYVFDRGLLTTQMEEQTFQFERWVTESGQLLGPSSAGISNHMYLAYRSGFFNGALIGVIDPCFDTKNTVNIGVGPGPRDYLIAISTPLLGTADGDGGTADDIQCGGGSVVLNRPGVPVVLLDKDGEPKNFETTEEYISAFPYSDDQYSITITGTGTEPLLSDEAAAKSATFDPDSGELRIPKVRVNEELISAKLYLQGKSARNGNGGLKFGLTEKNILSIEESDPFQATYDPANQHVKIPRVSILGGEPYSVTLKYHNQNNVEVIEATQIIEK